MPATQSKGCGYLSEGCYKQLSVLSGLFEAAKEFSKHAKGKKASKANKAPFYGLWSMLQTIKMGNNQN